jgi:MFS family permease
LSQEEQRSSIPEKKETKSSANIVLGIVMTRAMIAAIDTTIVILALPTMMLDLHSDLLTIIWVVISYLLVVTIMGTQVGRLGDMFGRVRMYNAGFALFAIGSALCGFSTNSW